MAIKKLIEKARRAKQPTVIKTGSLTVDVKLFSDGQIDVGVIQEGLNPFELSAIASYLTAFTDIEIRKQLPR